MQVIVWKDSFVLGVQQFDDHHQHLVGLINQAYDNYAAGAPTESIESILIELVDYATKHFAAEEQWMHEHSYPALDEHRAEHDRFLDRVDDMLKYHQGDRRYLLMEVLTFLHNSLIRHIFVSVADYDRYNATLSK